MINLEHYESATLRKAVSLAVCTLTREPAKVPEDSRSFLERLLTALQVSPLYSKKKGLHGVNVKASFKF